MKNTNTETWETSLTYKALKLLQAGIAPTMKDAYHLAGENFKIVKG